VSKSRSCLQIRFDPGVRTEFWHLQVMRSLSQLTGRSAAPAHRSKLPPVPCVIVFGGDDQEPLTLQLDMDADEVAKSLRGHSIQRIEVKGRVVWVNPQNVLYVEDGSAPSPPDEQAVSLPDVS
jgi:hypothetical protein